MKRTSTSLVVISLAFLFFCLFAFRPSRAQNTAIAQTDLEIVQLFELTGVQQSQSSVSIAATREQRIEVNFEKLETAQVLRLTLLDGKTYEAIRKDPEGFVRFAKDEYSWRGRIVGENEMSGDVVLTVKGKALSGLIYSPDAVYEIVPQANFNHVLLELDQSRFPACGGGIPVAAAPWGNSNPAPIGHSRSIPGLPNSPSADDGSQIDVLVVYTAAVRAALGGATQAQAFAQEAISTTNTVYQNSGITTRLRLVQSMEVNYADNGNGVTGLNWVTTDATVASTRDAAKADMVAMLTENATDVCGVGWLMDNVSPSFESAAFALVQRTCAIGGLTFAHELGHNQGCDHNPENGSAPSELAYPYAYGHWNSSANFRTVMSYPNPCPGCPRIPYFSTPLITYNGVPLGIADQRDNHRVINNTALTVSQFRESGGGGGGANLMPYQPPPWSDKIVVSNVTGTNIDSSLTTANTLYVDWAELNAGDTASAVAFSSALYVDGVLRQSWNTPAPLNPSNYSYVLDYSIGALAAGEHTLRIVIDSSSGVAESNESDNEYTKTITVSTGGGHVGSAGLYNPTSSTFFLRNSNSAGSANVTFGYGPSGAGWTPVVGDWDGNGTATAGLYNPTTSAFFLRNSNSAGSADLTFVYGPAGAGWLPIVGDWNGDGTDTVGLYQPSTATFFLKNSNSAGSANLVFSYGPAGQGWLPLAGDWNGDGVDTVGLYQPPSSAFFLKNTNSAGSTDIAFIYGPAGAGWTPVVGDWDQDRTVTAGLYNPATSTFFLRNTNTAGAANLTFSYGPAGLGWKPLAGDWDGQ